MEKPPAIVIQEALKDLLGGSIKEMMEAEISHHLGYEKWSDSDNARNGHKYKRVKSSYGNFSVEVPQDRKSPFAPMFYHGDKFSRRLPSTLINEIVRENICAWKDSLPADSR